MITAIVIIKKGILRTQFPTSPDSLYDQLGSIGISAHKRDAPVFGTNCVKVELAADDELGTAIIKKLSKEDTICGLNAVCNRIAKRLPFGYTEFADMLEAKPGGRYEFYKPYEAIPPTAHNGIKGLLEEIERFCATMDNYRKKCSEDEE